MNEENIPKKKIKKKRLNKKRLIKFLILLCGIILCIVYVTNIKITQIEITGTNYLTDTEIIDIAGIKEYPKLFSISSSKLKNNIKKLDLVNDCTIRKNLLGKVSISIDEAKPLFISKSNNQIVLSNMKKIDLDKRYLGLPTLINYVPDDVFNNLVSGLAKVKTDILATISEIEYAPSYSNDNQVIDNTRFLLRMNDSNTVYMNTINITQLNKYLDICSAILATQGEIYGILYLDSSTEENYSFESYEAIKREEEKKNEEQSEQSSELPEQVQRNN